jgi:excisionase family DNA binding protein
MRLIMTYSELFNNDSDLKTFIVIFKSRSFSGMNPCEYTTNMDEDIPPLPGYVSIKEAAKMLGISERRVYLYIEMKRLPAVRAADVLLIPLDAVKNFRRKFVGRPRKNTPPWRISSEENTQFITSILVQIRAGQEKQLMLRIEGMKQSAQHIFPGTVARYVAGSEAHPSQIEIVLIWRSTIMPNEVAREQALEGFRRALADVLDWDTAQYNHGKVFMHT